jgi:hypothetical protein
MCQLLSKRLDSYRLKFTPLRDRAHMSDALLTTPFNVSSVPEVLALYQVTSRGVAEAPGRPRMVRLLNRMPKILGV